MEATMSATAPRHRLLGRMVMTPRGLGMVVDVLREWVPDRSWTARTEPVVIVQLESESDQRVPFYVSQVEWR
jgi:hypothetical protein